MRKAGTTHLLAEMFAFQQPPQSKTDREFLRGHCNGNQFEDTPWVGEMYRQQAEEAGVDITGKVYKGTLAKYPGDPRAWVSGLGDVKRVLEERGDLHCAGAVNYKPPEREPVKQPAIAHDILDSMILDRLGDMPIEDAAKVELGELRHELTEQHKPHWAE